MKALSLIAAVAACWTALAADFSGTYGVWLGYLAGINATGDRAAFVGSGAGGEAEDVNRTAFVGAAAGAYSSHIEDCVGIGYRALRGSYDMTRVVAIGSYALTNRVLMADVTWINGQVFANAMGGELWLKPDPRMADTNAPIRCASGTLYLTATNIVINGMRLGTATVDGKTVLTLAAEGVE